jgi:hypothetical protein
MARKAILAGHLLISRNNIVEQLFSRKNLMNKILVTPSKPWLLWICPVLLWFVDWAYLRTATLEVMLDKEKDGWGMEIIGSLIVALLGVPLVIALLFFILRRYPGSSPLFNWNAKKKWLSLFWSTIFGIPILYSATEILILLKLSLYLKTLANLAYIYYYLVFCSTLVEKSKRVNVEFMFLGLKCKLP